MLARENSLHLPLAFLCIIIHGNISCSTFLVVGGLSLARWTSLHLLIAFLCIISHSNISYSTLLVVGAKEKWWKKWVKVLSMI